MAGERSMIKNVLATFSIGFIAGISPFLFMQLLPALLNPGFPMDAPGYIAIILTGLLIGGITSIIFASKFNCREPQDILFLRPGDSGRSDRYGQQYQHRIQGRGEDFGSEGKPDQCSLGSPATGNHSPRTQTAITSRSSATGRPFYLIPSSCLFTTKGHTQPPSSCIITTSTRMNRFALCNSNSLAILIFHRSHVIELHKLGFNYAESALFPLFLLRLKGGLITKVKTEPSFHFIPVHRCPASSTDVVPLVPSDKGEGESFHFSDLLYPAIHL